VLHALICGQRRCLLVCQIDVPCSVGQWLQYSKARVNPDCRLNVSFLCWPVHCTAHASPSGWTPQQQACKLRQLAATGVWSRSPQQLAAALTCSARCQRQTTDCTWHMLFMLHTLYLLSLHCALLTLFLAHLKGITGASHSRGGAEDSRTAAAALLPARTR
jgi:hypothetical protein